MQSRDGEAYGKYFAHLLRLEREEVDYFLEEMDCSDLRVMMGYVIGSLR